MDFLAKESLHDEEGREGWEAPAAAAAAAIVALNGGGRPASRVTANPLEGKEAAKAREGGG